MFSPRYATLLTALLALGALTQARCLLHAPEVAQTRDAFARQYPTARFERDIALDFGPAGMAMAAGLTRRWAPEAFTFAGPYLRYTRRVQVGVYSVRDLPPLDRSLDIPLPGRLRTGGWETILRVRDEEEHVWVLARPDRAFLDAFYVLVLGEEELVSVRMEGDFEKMIEFALTEHAALLDGDWAKSVVRKAQKHAKEAENNQ
jgi:hypothetical protein